MTPGEARPRTSAGRGCATAIALGCGGTVLLLVLMMGGCAYWTFMPGAQEPTANVIGSESTGFVHIADLAASEGARAMVEKLLRELERVQDAAEGIDVPEDLRWLDALLRSQRDYSLLLDLAAPEQATIALELDADIGEPGFVAAVNPRYFTRPARVFLEAASQSGESPGLIRSEYQGYAVYELAEPSMALSFRDGTLVVGSTLENLLTGLDRIAASEGAENVPQAGGFLSEDDPGDIYGRVPADLAAAVLLAGVPGGAGAIEVLAFGIRLDSEDSLDLRLTIQCRDAESARRVSAMLAEGIRLREAEFVARGLQVEPRLRTDDRRVIADIAVSGVGSAIEGLARDVVDTEDGDGS